MNLGWLLLKETAWRYLMAPVSPWEMAVLRRVTREPPWLRRADGVVIRTGSVCEQRRRQSQPLNCFGGCSLNRWQEGSETRPKGGPFSVHSLVLHLWGQAGFLKRQADDWIQICTTQSTVSLSSGQEPRDFLASITQVLESKTCNFIHTQSNYIILILKMLHQNIFLHN